MKSLSTQLGSFCDRGTRAADLQFARDPFKEREISASAKVNWLINPVIKRRRVTVRELFLQPQFSLCGNSSRHVLRVLAKRRSPTQYVRSSSCSELVRASLYKTRSSVRELIAQTNSFGVSVLENVCPSRARAFLLAWLVRSSKLARWPGFATQKRNSR